MAPMAPKGLSTRSRRFWREVTDKYELRHDELRVLEDACREMDLIDSMSASLADMPVMVAGSMGQSVVNPLVAELRQHRAVLRQLLVSLKLPDEPAPGSQGVESPRSVAARAAAKSRWAVAHGAPA